MSKGRHKKQARFLRSSVFAAALFALGGGGFAAPLDETQVFEWWDSGIITAEEATEILDLLEEDNQEEACLLAQTYAQETCDDASAREESTRNAPTKAANHKKSTARKEKPRPNLTPHGHALWKGRIDSAGHLESHRTELQVQFYRYRLRLGSQELLTYKNAGSEAHFGQVSTRELHSQIPLDTLWGTTLLYPLGNFHVAGLLDTVHTEHLRLGYGRRGIANIEAFYWHGTGSSTGTEVHSAGTQATFPFGQIALWWQHGQSSPLVKILLHDREKRKKTDEPLVLGWRTTAYLHREEIPQWARLSSTIQKSRLWGSQSLTILAQELANTTITGNARLLLPLQSDSLSERFKVSLESGPPLFRAKVSATCREAQENCGESDWKTGFTTTPWEIVTLGATARFHYRAGQHLPPPYIEISSLFTDYTQNRISFTYIIPQGNSIKNTRFRSEIHFSDSFLEFSLVCIFSNIDKFIFNPIRGYAEIRILF